MREKGYYWCRAKKQEEWDNNGWEIYYWAGDKSYWLSSVSRDILTDEDMAEIKEEKLICNP